MDGSNSPAPVAAATQPGLCQYGGAQAHQVAVAHEQNMVTVDGRAPLRRVPGISFGATALSGSASRGGTPRPLIVRLGGVAPRFVLLFAAMM